MGPSRLLNIRVPLDDLRFKLSSLELSLSSSLSSSLWPGPRRTPRTLPPPGRGWCGCGCRCCRGSCRATRRNRRRRAGILATGKYRNEKCFVFCICTLYRLCLIGLYLHLTFVGGDLQWRREEANRSELTLWFNCIIIANNIIREQRTLSLLASLSLIGFMPSNISIIYRTISACRNWKLSLSTRKEWAGLWWMAEKVTVKF